MSAPTPTDLAAKAAEAKARMSGAGNGLTSPRQPVPLQPAAQARKSAEQVIRAWAATLTPSNAPSPRHVGPLAWVRGEKVEELLNLLRKEGF